MNGSRFQLAYGIGENLKPEEINNITLKDKEVKIKDTLEELPDLIVKDADIARKYINYMNRPKDVMEINKLILNIQKDIESIHNINLGLVKPEKTFIGEDEEGEPVYNISLKEDLFMIGYRTQMKNKTDNINQNLNALKKCLLKK